MEAIVLAGGFGTRLKSLVSDVPKPMAPVGGRPFLCYILEYLKRFDINKVILSTGYKHETIEDFFGHSYKGIEIVYSVEKEPLGTGGAIKLALEKSTSNDIIVMNGDTFFQVDIHSLKKFQEIDQADVTICLKPMENFNRYGTVELTGNRVVAFLEKKPTAIGLINGGIYFIKRNLFDNLSFPEKFSFETDFLQKYFNKQIITGFISDSYFIDIGIPEDYIRAQEEIGEIFE